jgi:hypothetical protein
VLGLVEDTLSPHPLSGRALDALEAIGAARDAGVLRSELGRSMGVELKNFHFVVNHLTERGACVATPVVARAGPGAPTQTTSRLHLPRFAPRLAPGQALREGYGWGRDGVGGEAARDAVGRALEGRDELEDARKLAAASYRAMRPNMDAGAVRRRLSGRLARRGFSGEIVRRAVDEVMRGGGL